MDSMVLSPKKLIENAMKWEKRAFMEWKAIAYPREGRNNVVKSTTSNMVSEKGNFVVYTIDKRRFVLPLSYLSNHIFQELLKISKEEFGLSSSEPITLPCDSFFMNYMVSLVNRVGIRALARSKGNAIFSMSQMPLDEDLNLDLPPEFDCSLYVLEDVLLDVTSESAEEVEEN
ncbi:auxin-responsive protein SAUR68-like [Pyrus communis]|uniref:auxin-responsive protein SAUR68-like n=1 Tax=Pyrus communis TaxID=23211 RepID=UPI0035C12B5A